MKITIISLIYRSPLYADFFFESLKKYTPELNSGDVDFFFVANSANAATLKLLKSKKVPHVELNLPNLSEIEHFQLGFAKPEYLGRVYEAYNFGVSKAQGEAVILLNSDMVLSPGWLQKLLAGWDQNSIRSTNLVERHHPKFGTFPGAIERNFGSSPRNFQFPAWEAFCKSRESQVDVGSNCLPYMPALLMRRWFTEFGGYPHGNIGDGSSYENVVEYGDQHFFGMLAKHGIPHTPVPDVLCYHFKEGEKVTGITSWFSDIAIPRMAELLGLKHILRKCRQLRMSRRP